jgi:hypothetical protein
MLKLRIRCTWFERAKNWVPFLELEFLKKNILGVKKKVKSEIEVTWNWNF